MKSLLCFLMLMGIVLSGSATITNIPADYATIQAGIDASIDGDTVLVQPGIYYENVYLEEHAVVLGSLFLTTEDTNYIDQTIIDGSLIGSTVTFYYQNYYAGSNSMLIGFTIQNGRGNHGGGISCISSDPIICNNHIINNISNDAGGGIFLWTGSNPVISENLIADNTAVERGGGIFICWSYSVISYNRICNNHAVTGAGIFMSENMQEPTPEFHYNLIANNEASTEGGGLYAYHSKFLMSNTTITDNYPGTGVYLEQYSDVIISNTIVWNNGFTTHGSSIYSISYSDVEDTTVLGVHNIHEDPLFCWSDTANYLLQSDSPCIGTGEDSNNIGAFGVGCDAQDVLEDIVSLPLKCSLKQNYPNPFNASTTISYFLFQPTNVKLDIYDLLGHHIETISGIDQPAGQYRVTWNAGDFPSGMYFYKIQAGDFTETKKMLLVK